MSIFALVLFLHYGMSLRLNRPNLYALLHQNQSPQACYIPLEDPSKQPPSGNRRSCRSRRVLSRNQERVRLINFANSIWRRKTRIKEVLLRVCINALRSDANLRVLQICVSSCVNRAWKENAYAANVDC